MAYLHCHEKGCGWSQDDFWNLEIKWNKLFDWNSRPFGYNPLSLILEDIAEYWKPRLIGFDCNFTRETGLKERGKDERGFSLIHSWDVMKYNIKNHFKRLFTMKYRTYKSFKKAKESGKYKCPKCGATNNWDID